jgi:hypothetical protein
MSANKLKSLNFDGTLVTQLKQKIKQLYKQTVKNKSHSQGKCSKCSIVLAKQYNFTENKNYWRKLKKKKKLSYLTYLTMNILNISF